MSDKINGPSAYLSALSEAPREDLLSEVCRQKIRAETAESRVRELEADVEWLNQHVPPALRVLSDMEATAVQPPSDEELRAALEQGAALRHEFEYATGTSTVPLSEAERKLIDQWAVNHENDPTILKARIAELEVENAALAKEE